MDDHPYIPYAPDQMDAPVFQEPEISFLEHLVAAPLCAFFAALKWVGTQFHKRHA